MKAAEHRRWGLLAVLVVIIGLVYWLSTRHHGLPAKPDLPVSVSTARVTRSDVVIAITELGAAQAWQGVTIRAQVNGRLQRVPAQEGADVKAGDLIAEIDPAPYQAVLMQAQGALDRDKAQLEIARLDLTRYSNLVAEDSIAAQQLDSQKSLVKQLQGTVLIDEGAVAAARVNLDYCKIRSPVTGRVGVRLVDAGNLVSTVDTGGIITINQLVPMAVTFSVPQAELQRVSDASIGFSHALTTQAFSQDSGEPLGSGEVSIADNHVDSATGTVQMKARFSNVDRKLWPGQFVNVRLRLSVLPGSLTVPAAAISRGSGNTYVYVVGADAKVQVRTVTVKLIQDANAIIAAGLTAGETVVTDGQMALRPGISVLARDAAAAPPGAPPLVTQ
jgi:multidrug efflux system membrane fusion protein